MKKHMHFSILIFSIFLFNHAIAQKVVVIGMNHATPDGIAFVAMEDMPVTSVIYFSEDEYNNSTNLFSSGESVVQFIATSSINKGDVVFIKETASNTFTVDCTGGPCGNALEVSLGGSFALGSSGEHMYAYSDSDSDPTNGVTEIFSVMYTVPGSIGATEDPVVDHPSAVVVDNFASATPDRTEYNSNPASSRDGVTIADLEDPNNYVNGIGNADLSIVPFSNLTLGITDSQLITNIKVFPNPLSNYLYIVTPFQLVNIELYNIMGKKLIHSMGNTQLKVNHLPNGIYLLKLSMGKIIIYKKILKN